MTQRFKKCDELNVVTVISVDRTENIAPAMKQVYSPHIFRFLKW